MVKKKFIKFCWKWPSNTVEILNLGKLLFFSYNWKNFEPIRLQDFLITSLIDFLLIDRQPEKLKKKISTKCS